MSSKNGSAKRKRPEFKSNLEKNVHQIPSKANGRKLMSHRLMTKTAARASNLKKYTSTS